jgi:hypothetical protein
MSPGTLLPVEVKERAAHFHYCPVIHTYIQYMDMSLITTFILILLLLESFLLLLTYLTQQRE